MGTDYELFAFGGIIGKTSNSRRLGRVSYLGPNMIGTTGPQNAGIQHINAIQFPTNDPILYSTSMVPPNVNSPPATWVVQPFGVIMPVDRKEVDRASGANKSRSEYKSSILVATNRWLENTVVSTVGWRRDKYSTFRATDAEFDPATGFRRIGPGEFTLIPQDSGAIDKANYGVALHAPAFVKRRLPLGADVSLYYNRSDNFSPQAQRYSVWGNPIDPEKGGTKEYGARLSLFNGRFELRGTYYETGANLANAGSVTEQPINQALLRVEYGMENLAAFEANPMHAAGAAAFRQWLQTPGARLVQDVFRFRTTTNPNGGVTVDFDRRTGEVLGTTDTVSKGYEFEAIYNPTRNWRIAFNATQQKAVKDNTGRDVMRWIDEIFTPLLLNSPFADTPTSSTPVRQVIQGAIYQNLQRAALLDGSRAPELREWRWNAVSNYTFREGRLKGWSIGGAVRWQAEGAIGYPVIDDGFGEAIIDVQNPYMAPGQTDYDAWLRYTRRLSRRINWTAQLNIKNIGVGNELITVQTQPNGRGSAFRIREAQTWSLSNTFSF